MGKQGERGRGGRCKKQMEKNHEFYFGNWVALTTFSCDRDWRMTRFRNTSPFPLLIVLISVWFPWRLEHPPNDWGRDAFLPVTEVTRDRQWLVWVLAILVSACIKVPLSLRMVFFTWHFATSGCEGRDYCSHLSNKGCTSPRTQLTLWDGRERGGRVQDPDEKTCSKSAKFVTDFLPHGFLLIPSPPPTS